VKDNMHVYDWIDSPSEDPNETKAKEWLGKFCLPVYQKYGYCIDGWLKERIVSCEWNGRRIQCSGASRLGDVWLKEEGSASFYDYRVSVDELSNWLVTS